MGYKRGLMTHRSGQEDDVWLHLTALGRITDN